MTRLFNFLMVSMLPTFLGMASFATPVLNRPVEPAVHGIESLSARSANTCADPSLTDTVFQGFDGIQLMHDLDFKFVFVRVNTAQPSGPPLWSLEGPAFKAWPTEQPFTVPLFRLRATSNDDFIFMVGADANTPPVVSGFTPAVVIAWVYNTTTACDSIPLMSAVQSAASDHYYTTDALEHAGLLAGGWTDGGIIANVLPF